MASRNSVAGKSEFVSIKHLVPKRRTTESFDDKIVAFITLTVHLIPFCMHRTCVTGKHGLNRVRFDKGLNDLLISKMKARLTKNSEKGFEA